MTKYDHNSITRSSRLFFLIFLSCLSLYFPLFLYPELEKITASLCLCVFKPGPKKKEKAMNGRKYGYKKQTTKSRTRTRLPCPRIAPRHARTPFPDTSIVSLTSLL
jgi:hypothetical protein